MAQPTITFVNHASYIVDYEGIHLITDPWLEGKAFHDGWSLIEPTKLAYTDFSAITHIWFSHEHPDHFSPPNLRSIPEDIRKNITVLFQQTKDQKVINYCKQLNFKACIELPPTWFALTQDVQLLNVPHTDGDSWLGMKVGNQTLLNINDCVIEDSRQAAAIMARLGVLEVDVLFTQFSYANWVGNSGDTESHQRQAKKKLNEIARQVAAFRPKYIIPFASYVWFSHEENFYMNKESNKIDLIARYCQEQLHIPAVVLFPGERWQIGEAHDTQASVNKWLKSYAEHIKPELATKATSVSEADLLTQGNAFINTLKKNNTGWMRLFFKPTNIFIADYGKAFQLSLNGFKIANIPSNDCDIDLSSDAMLYCFKFLWGGATTRVNGRYQVPPNGKFYNWKLYFQTSELNNHGEKFDFSFIVQSALRSLRRKIFKQ